MFVRRPYLGELEIAVMEHLWDVDVADAKAIHRQVGEKRNISPNTIQSTADRLYKKGLLNREKVSHAFVYSPAVTREQLMAEMIDNVVDKLSGGRTEAMLSAFVDLASRIEQNSLDRLEELIAERRQKR
ncbi:BlaI/MecI/CopY family transcriptional regulator [Desulfuromonas acetexigens]|uniref:BlaI/MecI/CopY family transcriptional regulator n=1 Tax=Trichloromonas acetexigens TaxID=38815 RepID=A0A550JBD7_9BACT|nr:BlaI/MecI/CopY family transcriptional regulator [Desulfuromonas acetexigens]TRO80569.1 BlaI/MecI/CopY family transcriptional regulator [Desulfuromonas acetexigens]